MLSRLARGSLWSERGSWRMAAEVSMSPARAKGLARGDHAAVFAHDFAAALIAVWAGGAGITGRVHFCQVITVTAQSEQLNGS